MLVFPSQVPTIMCENAACLLTSRQWTVLVALKAGSVGTSHVNLVKMENGMFLSPGMTIGKCLIFGGSDTFSCFSPVFAFTLGQPSSSGHHMKGCSEA